MRGAARAESRGALLDEGGEALGDIRRLPARRLRLHLGVEAPIERPGGRGGQRLLHQPQAGPRRLGQPRCQGANFVHQRFRWHHAVDETDAQRLGGIDHVAEPAQLERLGEPDEPRQEVAAAPVRVQADAREGLAEAGLVRGDPQVARERQVEPRPGGDAVHGRDRRHRQGRQPCHGSAPRLEQGPQLLEARSPFLEPRHVVHVPAGAERTAGPGDHQHARSRIGGHALERGD